MKTIKQLPIILATIFLFSSCAKNDEKDFVIDMDLIINNWSLASSTVDGVALDLTTNCQMYNWQFNGDGSMYVFYYQSSASGCTIDGSQVNWQYKTVSDVIEITIGSTIHFKCKVLEVSSTSLRMQQVFPGLEVQNEVVIETFSKV